MIPVNELRDENKDIEDLCQILEKVIDEANARENAVICELVDRFIKRVDEHLAHESRDVYKELLNHGDHQARTIVTQFLDNTHELNRLCSRNKKYWKQMQKCTEMPESFGTEFREFMKLVRTRISLENDRLFPLFA